MPSLSYLFPHVRAIVLSSGLPLAGDCVNVVPSIPLDFHLTDCKFRCCLCYWLGLPLYSIPILVQNVEVQLILLEITKLGVEAVVIEFSTIHHQRCHL